MTSSQGVGKARRTKAQMQEARMRDALARAVHALVRVDEERGYLSQLIKGYERWLVIDANRPQS